MAQRSYNILFKAIQTLASTKVGVWWFSMTQQRLDILVMKLTGKYTLSSLLAGLPVVIVTAPGAKSGVRRSIPLLCIQEQPDPAEFALVATNWGRAPYPAWYWNLKAAGEAEGAIGGIARQYQVHEAHGEEYERYWQLATEIYLGFPKYRQRIGNQRQIPIMVMRLKEGGGSVAR